MAQLRTGQNHSGQLATAEKTKSPTPYTSQKVHRATKGATEAGLDSQGGAGCQRQPRREETGIYERTHKGPVASSWTKPEASICGH